LSVFFACATQAWNANAVIDTCAKGVALSHAPNAENAGNGDAGRVTHTIAKSAHADAIGLSQPASFAAEYAGDEHAQAFGKSFRKSDGSNARNGDAGHGKGQHGNEHGQAARHEWR